MTNLKIDCKKKDSYYGKAFNRRTFFLNLLNVMHFSEPFHMNSLEYFYPVQNTAKSVDLLKLKKKLL